MENKQDIRKLANQRLQEIYANMYILSEEARVLNGFLSLTDQVGEDSSGELIHTSEAE